MLMENQNLINYLKTIKLFSSNNNFVLLNSLSFPESWNLASSDEVGIKMILDKGVSLLIILTVFWTLLRVVDYVGVRLKYRAEKTESKVDD